MKTKPFHSIVKNYRAIFLDSYGVLKNYKGAIPGAAEVVQEIQQNGQELYILTNDASRSPLQLAEQFNRLGMKNIEPSHIISSGMMAKEFLENKISNGRVAYLGTEHAAHYIEDAGLQTVSINELDLEDIDDISALVFMDDEGFDWNNGINKTVNLLRKKNMPVVVANSDLTYPVSHNDVAIATGAVADLVESIVKKEFIHFGKPDGRMFMYAYELLIEKASFKKNEILMVGDTLHTDIIGGNKFGLRTVLTLSGNTRPNSFKTHIKATGVIPDYICESIAT